MTREQMIHYLGNPDQLNEKTLVELREILDEFPYFQTAHLLYVRNLLNEKNFRFSGQLKLCAVHATDRTVVYNLLNQKSTIPKEAVTTDSPENIASETIPVKRVQQLETKNQQDLTSFDAAYRLEGEFDAGKTLAQMVKEINEAAEIHKRELIQKFQTAGLTENRVHMNEKINDTDEFITETLAKIYIKQELYHKAIDAFKRLALKYPEKSIYFATQIEEVKNLIKK